MNAAVEYQRIVDTLAGTAWTVTREVISGVDTAVLTCRVERFTESPACSKSDTAPGKRVTKNPEKPSPTRADSFRPYPPMGVQTGLAGTDKASVPSQPASSSGSFGDLSTILSMSTGQTAPVISYDTEFTPQKDGSRRIDSYQFSCLDPEDERYRIDVVLLPLEDSRLSVEACLAVVIRESGLWSAVGLPDPRGIPRGDFWIKGDYRAGVDALYKKHRVGVVLAGHFLNADLTAFARPRRQRGDGRYNDILRRVTSASGGLVSLKPVRMIARTGSHGRGERWLPLSIVVRDTMGQSAPGSKSLAALGEVCGVPKLEVGDDAIKNMTQYRRDHLVDFLEYGANDAVIVLEYLTAVWGVGAVPPVTLSGGGARALREGIKKYWGIEGSGNAEFMARFQGLVSVDEGQEVSDDGLSYYAVRSLTPVDGDANQVHSAFRKAFHGGAELVLASRVILHTDLRPRHPVGISLGDGEHRRR